MEVTTRRTSRLEVELTPESFSSVVANFAGKRLYVPPVVGEDHPLRKLPANSLAELVGKFSKLTINVPVRDVTKRNQAIVRAYYVESKDYAEIARTYGLSERWITKIISDHARQQNLAGSAA